MSKKHFEALAEALAETRPSKNDYDLEEESERLHLSNVRAQWNRDVQIVANACAAMNPNFDYQRFIAACKGEK